MAATTQAQVNVVVTGLAQLDRLQSSVDKVGATFGRLRTTLIGVGFAAFGKAALTLGDQISDLADATDISIGKIKEFGTALEEAGGKGDAVDIALTTFSNKLQEARAGSIKAQEAFRKLGVSRDDLANPDVNRLLDQTVQGLANLGTASARGAASMDMFGKAGRGAAPEALNRSLKEAAGSGDQYAQSIKRADELQTNFNNALKTLKLLFLEAFEPAINKVNELGKALKENKDTANSIIAIFKAVGVALATSFAVGAALGLVRVIGSIGRGITSVINLATGATGAGIFRAAGPHMTALRGIAMLVTGIGTALYTATQLFDDFGDIVGNVAARSVEALGNLAVEVLNFPTDAIAGLLNLFGAGIKDPVGLGTPLKLLIENARKSREEYEKTAKAKKEALKPPPGAQPPPGSGGPVEVDRTALDNQLASIKSIGEEYDNNIAKQIRQLQVEGELIGAGKTQSDVRKAQADIEEKNKDAIEKLSAERLKLNVLETDPEVLAQYDETIDKLKKALDIDKARVKANVENNASLTASDRLIQYSTTAQFDAEKNIQSIRDQARRNTLPDIQARYDEITTKIRDNAQAAIAVEQAELPRGQKLSQQRIAEIYAAMTKEIKDQKGAVDGLVKSEEARKFNEFTLRSQQTLQDELNKATDDYNKLYLSPQQKIMYDIEASARAKAKLEVDAIEAGRREKLTLEERSALQAQYYNEAIKGSVELGEKLDKTRESSRTFGYGWKTALDEYADNAANAANRAQAIFLKTTQGMEDMIVNFAKTGKFEFKNFVASLAEELLRSQIKQLMSSIFNFSGSNSGGNSAGNFLGNIFAGMFAQGGTIPGGQIGIVGEKGPEFVSGPATVTPMTGSTTNVVYNINAVDALSFKSMIARDPSFIHAVAMQGAKGTPGRY